MRTASKEEGLPNPTVGNEHMLHCTSYTKDIANDVSAGSTREGEGTCGGGAVRTERGAARAGDVSGAWST